MTDTPAAQPPSQPASSSQPAPSAPVPDAQITLGTAEIVDFTPQPAPRKRRRTAIVSGVAAVLVAAGGVGAYAGVRAWTGSGIVEPESAMPAGTAAFLRVDLKPGYRDQIAFDGLAKKFPGRGESTTDLVTRIERKMLEGSGLDYDKDVAPWFGQRAGIGAFADKSDHVTGLVALASTDDAKAKQTLTKQAAAHPGSFGFVVRDGYALLAIGGTDPQATAASAATAAATANLADDKNYRASVSHLPGNNLVVGYADLSKVGPLAGNALSGALATGGLNGFGGADGMPVGGLGLLPGVAGSPTDTLAKLTGHIAVGVGVVDDGVEIHTHMDGTTPAATDGADAKATLDAMPDSAIVGVAARGLPADSPALKQLDSLFGKLDGMAAGVKLEPLQPGHDGVPGDGGAGLPPAMAAEMSNLVKSVLTAKVISIGFGGVTNGMPNLRIAVDARDSATATKLYQGAGVLAGAPGVHLSQNGTTVRADIGTALTGGKLGDNALYREALKGAGNSSVAAFVDVQKLLQGAGSAAAAGGSDAANLAPIKAIGVSTTASGTSSDTTVRIIIK